MKLKSELKDVWGVYDQYGQIVTDGGAGKPAGRFVVRRDLREKRSSFTMKEEKAGGTKTDSG